MLPDEVRPYVEHRLKIVGWSGNPQFEPEAIALLAEESGGIPRVVNTLAQAAMERAAETQSGMIDLTLMESVCNARRETSPQLALQNAVPAQIRSISRDVHALRATLSAAAAADEDAMTPQGADRMTQIEARLARIETRLSEQDEMFATILSKMIDWIEEDEALGASANRAA